MSGRKFRLALLLGGVAALWYMTRNGHSAPYIIGSDNRAEGAGWTVGELSLPPPVHIPATAPRWVPRLPFA